MIIEYTEELNKFIIYCSFNTNKSDWHKLIIPSTRFIEKIENITVISGTPYLLPKKIEIEHSKIQIKCPHNQDFLAIKIQKMANETLVELIDSWTCHIPIPKSIIFTPNQETILLSHFYVLIHQKSLPDCCSSDSIFVKIFLNELNTDFSFQKTIFDFLQDCFLLKDFLVIKYKNKNYEIKYFYKSNICTKNLEMVDCLKLGIKSTDMIFRNKEVVNEYFMKEIYLLIARCGLGVKFNEYDLCLLGESEI